MLEKKSGNTIDQDAYRLVKTATSERAAYIERSALRMLGAAPALSTRFPVPHVLERTELGSHSTCMTYIPGFCVHDLMGILNDVIEYHPSRETVRKAVTLRSDLISVAVSYLHEYQSQTIQGLLDKMLRPYAVPYAYQAKLQESMAQVLKRMGYHYPEGGLLDEIQEIGEHLTSVRSVYFRDAALHNLILRTAEFTREEIDEICKQSSDLRHQPHLSMDDLSPLLKRFTAFLNGVDIGAIKVINIDFEQSAEKVSQIDDWVHIFAAEVVGLRFHEALTWTCSILGVGDERLYCYSALYRALRAWSRRLFYRYESTEMFLRHFRYQTLPHNHRMACEAIEVLRRYTGQPTYLRHLAYLLAQSGPYADMQVKNSAPQRVR